MNALISPKVDAFLKFQKPAAKLLEVENNKNQSKQNETLLIRHYKK